LNDSDLWKDGLGSRSYLDLITHDLKNLNQGVFGYLELLEVLPETTDLQKRFLDEALSYVRMANNLIRSLEVEEKGQTSKSPQGLYKVIIESQQCISNVNRNVKLELDASEVTRGLKVDGSRLIVDMFIYVLDLMSRKARNGKLKVHASAASTGNGKVQVRLSGDLPPLSKAESEGLFDMASEKNGMKMGRLVLCRKIAQRFGGSIDYEPPGESSLHGGGSFVMTLPEVE
jgi:light-regulated signal transduction histidine kinase (bacteriophytochrome)